MGQHYYFASGAGRDRLFLTLGILINWRGTEIIMNGREPMPTIRQQVGHQRVSADRFAIVPVKPTRVESPSLWVVQPDMSAIEYIVATAHPGEVMHVDDGDYHNSYLWRSYEDNK
jgi:hypothetical protein